MFFGGENSEQDCYLIVCVDGLWGDWSEKGVLPGKARAGRCAHNVATLASPLIHSLLLDERRKRVLTPFETAFTIAIRVSALKMIAMSIIIVESKIWNISCNEIFCHTDNPHRQRNAIAIPARAAAVFFLTFNREKINIRGHTYLILCWRRFLFQLRFSN